MFGSRGAGSAIKIARVPGDGTRPPDHYDVTRTHANALSTRVPNNHWDQSVFNRCPGDRGSSVS